MDNVRDARRCVFFSRKFINDCAVMRDGIRCDAENCKWYKTEEMYFESLKKAAANYKKRTGRNDYYDKYCPKIYQKKIKELVASESRKNAV